MDKRLVLEATGRSGLGVGSRSRNIPGPHFNGSPADGALWRGLAAAADGALAMTSDGRITLWNGAAEKIMGYTAGEVLGRRCCDVFAACDSTGNRFCSSACRLLALIKSGAPIESFDVQTRSRNGRAVWLNMSTIVLPGPDARGSLGIRTFRDVTAVKDVLALIRDRLTGVPARRDPIARLTRRETELLRLMVSGATNRALAEQLHVSPATVRNHTHSIFEKLGVPNRVAAVIFAISQFMI